MRAELLRPGLSGGGGLSVDIGGGAGAGRGTGAAITGADAEIFMDSLGASLGTPFNIFAGATTGALTAVLLPTGLTSDFTATFKGELAEGFLTILPWDNEALTAAFSAVLTAAGAAAVTGDADTDFFAATFLAGSMTAGKFFSRDFTMCFLLIAVRAIVATGFLR